MEYLILDCSKVLISMERTKSVTENKPLI